VCFGWCHHPSSGAQTTVSTASDICHTVIAICRYRGSVGTGLSVLWVVYLELKTRQLIWLISKHSPLSLTNKLLVYKTILKPIWTYGLALWGCAASSNLAIIQRYQAKILRQITNTPRYVTNLTLHKDLCIPQVRTALQELTDTHRTALETHPNPLMAQILAPPNSRRLQRKWTLDVIS
jgi:hypothetical protein